MAFQLSAEKRVALARRSARITALSPALDPRSPHQVGRARGKDQQVRLAAQGGEASGARMGERHGHIER